MVSHLQSQDCANRGFCNLLLFYLFILCTSFLLAHRLLEDGVGKFSEFEVNWIIIEEHTFKHGFHCVKRELWSIPFSMGTIV